MIGLRVTQLMEYEVWANAAALAPVRTGANSGSIHSQTVSECLRWFSHIQAGRRVWLDRIRSGSSDGTVLWPDWDVDRADQECLVMNAAFEGWLRESPDLERVVEYSNTTGARFATPVSEILWHLFSHGGYHRGQIAAALRSGGLEPAKTDFINFVRE